MLPHAEQVKPGKVLLAMSGGVDSSVAAALLQRAGHEVVGAFMRLGETDELICPTPKAAAEEPGDEAAGTDTPRKTHKGCCSVGDAADARHVAALLNIPFYVVNFRRDFGRVIDYFVSEYNAGRTPNPCVRCNDWLKFGKLHDYARSIDCDYVATGHYARVDHDRPALLRGLDHRKDQSYVLFGTPREQLSHMLLPIGEMEKPAVRRLADELGLPVFDKPDSQEICFVPDDDYAGLVDRRTPGGLQEGEIRDTAGNRVGTHAGQQRYTIGQRRGLNLALGYPIYVVGKDPQTNTVVVGSREDLRSTGCEADQANWLIDDVPQDWQPCQAKVRYNSPPVKADVRSTGEALLTVRFSEPIEAVTPGQAVVCYDGDTVLGGGWITRALH